MRDLVRALRGAPIVGAFVLSLLSTQCARPRDDRDRVFEIARLARAEAPASRAPLEATLPHHARDALRLTAAGTIDAWIELHDPDAAPVPARDDGDAVVFAGARPDTDVVWMREAGIVEELRLLRSDSAPATTRYRVRLGPAIADLRVREGRIEAVSHDGAIAIAASPPFAIDAMGVRRPVLARAQGEGDERLLELELSTSGLRFPVVVDPAWTSAKPAPFPTLGHAAVRLTSGPSAGGVLIMGGQSTLYSPDTLDTAAIWTASGGWKPAAKMKHARREHVAATTADGKVLVFGGQSDGGAEVEVYDPIANTWTDVVGVPYRGLRRRAIVTLPGGRVLAIGGDGGITATAICDLYDPAASPAWTTLELVEPRAGHGATLVGGSVVVTGGANVGVTATAEVLDLGASPLAFALTGTMGSPRESHVAVALPGGAGLVVAGGVNDKGTESSAELWSPTSGTFSPLPSMSVRRAGASGVLLGEGAAARVLIAGGKDLGDAGPAFSTAELFAPIAGTWSAAPPMAVRRIAHTATVLEGGAAALIVGGVGSTVGGSAATTSAEVFSLGDAPDAGADAGPDAVVDSGPDSDAAGDAAATVPADDAGSGPPVVTGPFTSCTRGDECPTGFCVDGVCCDSRCAEPCHSCALPGSPGTCTLAPLGVDLRGDCAKGASCLSTCGPGGACVGATEGTQCAASRCTGPSTGVGPAHCVETGAACPKDEAVPFDCGAYVCEPAFGACRSSCSDSRDCAPGFLCDTPSGRCLAVPAADDEAGCGCRIAGRERPFTGVALATLALAIAGRLRRRRARSDARGSSREGRIF